MPSRCVDDADWRSKAASRRERGRRAKGAAKALRRACGELVAIGLGAAKCDSRYPPHRKAVEDETDAFA